MSVVRRIAAGCGALVLLSGGCEAPLSPDASPDLDRHDIADAAARLDGTVAVPFEARFFTDLVSIAPDERCGAPPRLLNVQEGVGEATHLGRFSVRITFCIDPSQLLDDGRLSPGESMPYDAGVGTLVAADGDQLHIAVAGAVLPSDHPDFDFEFADPYGFAGGTGRFAGAGGGGVTSSFVNFRIQPSRTEHVWTGTLTLPRGR